MFFSINTNDYDSLKNRFSQFSNKIRFYSKAVDGGLQNCIPFPPIAVNALIKAEQPGAWPEVS